MKKKIESIGNIEYPKGKMVRRLVFDKTIQTTMEEEIITPTTVCFDKNGKVEKVRYGKPYKQKINEGELTILI